jgi:hypothetical protein
MSCLGYFGGAEHQQSLELRQTQAMYNSEDL